MSKKRDLIMPIDLQGIASTTIGILLLKTEYSQYGITLLVISGITFFASVLFIFFKNIYDKEK